MLNLGQTDNSTVAVTCHCSVFMKTAGLLEYLDSDSAMLSRRAVHRLASVFYLHLEGWRVLISSPGNPTVAVPLSQLFSRRI